MRIIVCMDSFKGTLSAAEACRVAAEGLRQGLPECEIMSVPLGDGGESTASALAGALGGQWRYRTVTGPLPEMRVRAGWVLFEEGGDRKAVVEMAQASGMIRLNAASLDPMRTTTRGTGELLRSAIEEGVKHIYLGVGGSATVDCGTGAAAALGWRFLDGAGREVVPCGGNLRRIVRLVRPPELRLPPVEVLCDVDNPLCGERGAARVFAPQKGAGPAQVRELEAGLEHMAHLIEEQLGVAVRDLPGAGAAGGLGAGAVAFMGARLTRGIETVLRITGLERMAQGADWLVTGEGSFDEQSLMGKVVSGVAELARRAGARTAVLAGRVQLSPEHYPPGVKVAVACSPPEAPPPESAERAREQLFLAACELARMISADSAG